MSRGSFGRKLKSAASGESGARGRGTNVQDVRGATGNQLNNDRRPTSNRSVHRGAACSPTRAYH